MYKLAGWPGRYINVWCCGVLSLVLLQLKDPLELFVNSTQKHLTVLMIPYRQMQGWDNISGRNINQIIMNHSPFVKSGSIPYILSIVSLTLMTISRGILKYQ